METTTTARGRFLWYDLLTPAPEDVQDFYTSVIGWTTEAWGGAADGTPYTMWVADGTPVGGSMSSAQLAEPAPPHWLIHIGTDDLDQTLRDVTANGGTVLEPARELDEVGRFALCRDPGGAVFMAYEPETAEPPGPPARGHVSWNELAAHDVPAALAFYRDTFGWTEGDAMDMGPDGTYQMFNAGPNPAGGIYPIGDKPMQPAWTPYVKIDDLDAALERARAGGGSVIVEPMEVPGGDRVAVCTDPQGAMFGLHEVAAR
jgi:uncharacterized protein